MSNDSYLVAVGKNIYYILLLTVVLSCQSLLITYSKSEGLYSYSPASTILLAEIAKFCISATILKYHGNPLNFRLTKETFAYCLPALIYFIQNNLVFAALYYVDPTTYQVLTNLKILTTGILFRVLMDKELTNVQWAALVLLMVGCGTSQIPSNASSSNLFAIPLPGLIICIVMAFTSASAGIATEYIMKKTTLKSDPLHTQNIHLYFYGIIFNMIGYLIERESGSSFFDGYNTTTFLVVVAYSVSGLLVSVIMRYADNMVKIYAVAVSMVLTMVLSVVLFKFQPNIQLLYGITIITVSILMYFGIITDKQPTPPRV